MPRQNVEKTNPPVAPARRAPREKGTVARTIPNPPATTLPACLIASGLALAQCTKVDPGAAGLARLHYGGCSTVRGRLRQPHLSAPKCTSALPSQLHGPRPALHGRGATASALAAPARLFDLPPTPLAGAQLPVRSRSEERDCIFGPFYRSVHFFTTPPAWAQRLHSARRSR